MLYKYNILKKVEYLTDRVKRGLELYPLCSEHTPHPSYVQYEDHYFVKSGILMHIVDQRIQEHFSKLLRILIKECEKTNFTINNKMFAKKFKKICGFYPRFLYNWMYRTGAAEITVTQDWNKKNNTLELTIEQQNLLVHHLNK